MNRLPRVLTRAPHAPLALSLLVLSALGCGGSGDGAACPAPTVTAPSGAPAPSYSPFVLDLRGTTSGDLPFTLVSFKDVGMSLPDDASRQLAYESLAEALSLELAELAMEHAPPMTSSVRHDHHIADPTAHLSCEIGHLYVDLWRSGADGPYGYSLWSGCGEDDQFAYNERVSVAPGTAANAMDPLAEEIAESLEGALRRRCFQRAC